MTEGYEFHPVDGSLDEAKSWLRNVVKVTMATCPCCQQNAKIYRVKITNTHAKGLIDLCKHYRRDWGNLANLDRRYKGDGGKIAELKYWGIVEEMPKSIHPPDGIHRGWWRITEVGENFLRGYTRLPKYITKYANRRLGVHGMETVSIHDVLGTHFNFEDLMNGV